MNNSIEKAGFGGGNIMNFAMKIHGKRAWFVGLIRPIYSFIVYRSEEGVGYCGFLAMDGFVAHTYGQMLDLQVGRLTSWRRGRLTLMRVGSAHQGYRHRWTLTQFLEP